MRTVIAIGAILAGTLLGRRYQPVNQPCTAGRESETFALTRVPSPISASRPGGARFLERGVFCGVVPLRGEAASPQSTRMHKPMPSTNSALAFG